MVAASGQEPNMAYQDAPRIGEMPQDEETIDQRVGGAQVTRRGNSAVVDFNPGASRMSADDSDEHSANIVDDLDEQEQADLANTIIDWVDVDLESRKDWDQRMEQAMELMGLNNIPMEELPFDGASAVTYPIIGEAVVQFQSRAIEEVFPSEGPVKVKIVGEPTVEVEEQADRVKNHMNYQILDQDRSYFWHVDQMLFYLPLGGSAFKKTYFDSISEMVVSRFVKSPDFIVPYIATDLASSPRYTHRMFKNTSEMKKLFASGFWAEIDLPKITPYAADTIDDRDREFRDQADSRSADVHPDDAIYTVYECHCDMEFEMDEERYARSAPLPYIVTVERETRKVLSIRRNWKEADPLFMKRMWFTHYRYLPGIGFYGFGLLHMIGSVAEATSGTIRALLDSAAFANMQGGYVSNDAKMKPGDEHISPGMYKEVNMSAEELNKAFYTPPFKEPSRALALLFQELKDAGKAFSSATEVMTGEASNTGPVGTTIALIEQGSKPFSAIHRRLHMAAAEEFKLRAELNYEFLPDQYPYKVEGAEGVVMKNDYDGRIDVIPISDPNIFSSTQRIAQGQALIELADGHPELYNQMEVHERFLRAIRIPDPESLLKKEVTVREDPVQENMLQGQGAQAFMEQDHDAHIAVHMMFTNGLNEEALELMGPIMQAHMAEHYAMKYFNDMNRELGGQLPPPGSFTEENQMPPEVELQIAQAAAQVPQLEIMPPSEGQDPEQMAMEREEARKDEAHAREQDRKDEAALADMNRRDLEALSKDERDDAVAQAKQQREDAAAKAKKKREDDAAAAKITREKKVAAAKPKPKAQGK
jgi:hypothetical protein